MNFSIGLSALRTAQIVISMTAHNVANANTPGYKRLTEYNSEVNFSGPNNVPFLPAGVKTSIRSVEDKLFDNLLNSAANDFAESEAILDGVNDLLNAADTTYVEEKFSEFMNASHAAMVNPSDPVRQEALKLSGQAFATALQKLGDNINGASALIQRKIDLKQIEIVTIQKELSELSRNGVTDQNELQALISRIHLLTSSIRGYQKVLNGVVPPIVGIYNNVRAEVIDGINSSYGHNLIDPDSGRFNWVAGGNVHSLTEFGNQKFNSDMGILKTNIGAAAKTIAEGNAILQDRLDALKAEAARLYGVDLVEETVKSMKYQRMYEAAAMVIKTQDQMLGTLLSIRA